MGSHASYKGKPCGVVREYSDNLLMFRLKALLPDKYRERVAAPSSIATIDLNKLPDHLIARIAVGEGREAGGAAIRDRLDQPANHSSRSPPLPIISWPTPVCDSI